MIRVRLRLYWSPRCYPITPSCSQNAPAQRRASTHRKNQDTVAPRVRCSRMLDCVYPSKKVGVRYFKHRGPKQPTSHPESHVSHMHPISSSQQVCQPRRDVLKPEYKKNARSKEEDDPEGQEEDVVRQDVHRVSPLPRLEGAHTEYGPNASQCCRRRCSPGRQCNLTLAMSCDAERRQLHGLVRRRPLARVASIAPVMSIRVGAAGALPWA